MANPTTLAWRHTAVVLSLLLLASLCRGRQDDDWDHNTEIYDDTGDDSPWDDSDSHDYEYKHRPYKEKGCPSESPTPPSPTCPAKESPSASPSPSCPKKKSPSPSPSPSCPKQKSPSPSPSSMVPSRSPSPSASASPVPSESASPSPSPSPSASSSPPPESPSGSPSVSSTSSLSPSPSLSATPSTTPSPTPSSTPSPSSSPSTSVSPILSTPGPSTLPSSTPLASVCPQPLLGVAAGFSAFVFGNETDEGSNATVFSVDLVNGDFESAVAVNGGLRLRSFGVFQNSPCTDQASQGSTLIVNGPIDVVDTHLFCGNLLVADQSDVIRPPTFESGNGVVVSNVSIDFSSVRTNLTGVSAELCALANATPADTTIFGDVRLRATGLETEVFTVDVSTLSRTGFMRLTNADASATKSVIINVLGSGTARFTNFFFDATAIPQGLITWNICSADRVVIENFLFPGTLLAPAASVTLQKAQVVGSVVASSLTGTGGGQINVALCP